MIEVVLSGMLLLSNTPISSDIAVATNNIDQTQTANIHTTSYNDVKQSHWAFPVIEWATEKGIINGYPDGTFKPNKSVSESEFLAMIIRAYDPNNLQKLDKTYHWADSYYLHSVKMNYPTEGAKDSTKRSTIIDREYVAEIIAGTQGVNYKEKDAIHYLLVNGLAQGKGSKLSIDGYDGNAHLTRAQAVTFINNVLKNGIKDEDGNPVLLPRPEKPSNPSILVPLPDSNQEKPKPEEPSDPSSIIGNVDAKELYNQTVDYAHSLGYTITEFVNTSGRFTDKEGEMAVVSFMHRPGDGISNALSVTARDWGNNNNAQLFIQLIENYGVDSELIVNEINNLSINSGKQFKSQDIVFILDKRNVDGNIQVVLTIRG